MLYKNLSKLPFIGGKNMSWFGKSFCVPGSEIPKWFDYQTAGCYIELPRDSLNLSRICIVIAFEDHHDDGRELIVNFELLLKSQDAYYKKVAGGLIQAWHKDDAPDCFESDHIFLGYDCNMYTSGFPVCLTIVRPSLISMLATMIEYIWNVAR